MDPFHWICPICDHAVMVTDAIYRCHATEIELHESDRWGKHVFNVEVVDCPNPDCRQSTMTACLNTTAYAEPARCGTPPRDKPRLKVRGDGELPVKRWNLIPPLKVKMFPPYVPEAIRNDYTEACLIREHSPKASATLARRCLQGMIRDFWKISKPRLYEEIKAIKDKVDPLTWKAIEAVRHVGNIGAHMENDVNIIIDVDPDEALQLVNLVETLIHDWYVVSHERERLMQAVVTSADAKMVERKGSGQR